MKQNKRRALAAACALLMSSLTGCGDTRFVLTTGLAADEVFKIGGVTCDLSEALVYLVNQKNQYEEIYGIEMWHHNVGDITLEEYMKSQTISQLAQVKSMVLLAGEKEIELSEEETALAQSAAEAYFSTLDQNDIELLQVDVDTIRNMYEDYCLSYKAFDQITEDVSIEISDDEARIIQLQQIFVPEKNLAKELKEKLDEGEDFDSLASNYSKASQPVIAVARGDKEEAYEDVAFELNNDEISEVVEADGGYYILKCLDTYLEDASDANKLRVEQQQRSARFQEIYAEIMKDTLSEYQEKLWDEVKFEDYEDVKTSDFFEIYQDYFE